MGDIRDWSGFASIFLFASCLTFVARREPEERHKVEIDHLGEQTPKARRCDSYLQVRNYERLTDPLTGVGARRCYRI